MISDKDKNKLRELEGKTIYRIKFPQTYEWCNDITIEFDSGESLEISYEDHGGSVELYQ